MKPRGQRRVGRPSAAEAFRPLIDGLLGNQFPVAFRFWDGSALGPPDPPATVASPTPPQPRPTRPIHPGAPRRARSRLSEIGGGKLDLAVLDALYRQPLVNAKWVGNVANVVPATANKILSRLEQAGILRETTGRKRDRVFRYDAYLARFDQPTPAAPRGVVGMRASS